MITIDDVSVRDGEAMLLQNITFTIERASNTVLLGPNGSGKTTLLRSIAGAMTFEGVIEIDGASIRNRSPKQLARLRAYAQQEPAFPADMIVEHFVLLGRAPYQARLRGPTSEDISISRESLAQCRIERLRERKLGSLSGGERRRAALAQTLAQRTPVVLLDEPTSSLDIGQQQTLLELVDSIRLERETTFVTALHDLTLARQYATRVALLRAGCLVNAGSVESVLQLESLESHYETTLAGFSDDTTHAIVPRRHRRL